MASIAPSERLRCELQDLVADRVEAIGRLGAPLILQQRLVPQSTRG